MKGKAEGSEHELQVHCIEWFRWKRGVFKDLLFAIPNGGQRDIRVASRLKAEGVIAGVPDLFLAVPMGNYHGLFIEMKNGTAGRVSEAQKREMEALRCQGYGAVVCHCLDEFIEIIEKYLHGDLDIC